MKILVTNYNKTYSVESDEDVDAEGLADMFKGLMVSMGFHPKNVDELFNTEYKWFAQEGGDTNRQGHLQNSTPFMDSFEQNDLNETEQKMVDKKAEEWQCDLYKPEVVKRSLEDFSNSIVNKWHKDCREEND